MPVYDAIVVGCGIMGSTVTKALRARKLNVLALDSHEDKAGTPASGGHMKLEWSGMDTAEFINALALLSDVWGVWRDHYTTQPLGEATDILRTTTVHRVDIDAVVKYRQDNCAIGYVHELLNLHTNKPAVRYAHTRLDGTGLEVPPWNSIWSHKAECRLLVLCTGVWANSCLHGIRPPELDTLQAKQGISFRWEGKLREGGFIQPWAPYKQIVGHQQSLTSPSMPKARNTIWVGDGTAILENNWTKDRNSECLVRCREALTLKVEAMEHNPFRHNIGLRPYVKLPKADGKAPCLFRKLAPAVWLATGAGKNGTIAAGWVTNKLLQELDRGRTP